MKNIYFRQRHIIKVDNLADEIILVINRINMVWTSKGRYRRTKRAGGTCSCREVCLALFPAEKSA